MEPQDSFIKPNSSESKGNFLTKLKKFFPKFGKQNSVDDVRRMSADQLLKFFLSGTDGIKQMTSGRSALTYFKILSVAAGAYFLSDTASLFTDALVPEPPVVSMPHIARKNSTSRSFQQYSSIINRDIFSSEGKIPSDSGANGPARKTTLPINLIGTVVMQDELKSIASIEDRNANLVFPVRVDDVVNNRIRITKIEHLRVYFVNQGTGQLEYVEILDDIPNLNVGSIRTSAPQKASNGVSEVKENYYEIEKSTIEKSLSNMGQILQQARAIPNFDNGMMDGFRLVQIDPKSIYSSLGIVENDIICGINGEPLNDVGKAMQLFNDLKSISNLELCIKRNGKKMVKSYVVK